jgi:hypothetical protein
MKKNPQFKTADDLIDERIKRGEHFNYTNPPGFHPPTEEERERDKRAWEKVDMYLEEKRAKEEARQKTLRYKLSQQWKYFGPFVIFVIIHGPKIMYEEWRKRQKSK